MGPNSLIASVFFCSSADLSSYRMNDPQQKNCKNDKKKERGLAINYSTVILNGKRKGRKTLKTF
jgi:hypothetical protein